MERFLAAILATDQAAVVNALTPRVAELTLSDRAKLLVFFEEDPAMVEPLLEELVRGVKPGMSVRYLLSAKLPGAAALLEKHVPSRWKQVRSAHAAHTWSTGTGLTTVVGQGAPLLTAAQRWLEASNEPPPLEQLVAERAAQAASHDDFFSVLMARKARATPTIAAASVVFFALQWWWGSGNASLAAVRMGAASGSLVAAGEVWRLLAPMLLHGSVFHLALNLVALFSFGTFLERLLGWRRYVALYVLSGLGGGIASSLRSTDVISVGASGGIWGLMLAGAMLVTLPRGRLPALVVAAQRQRAWTPVVINAMFSLKPGIDLLAHFGGGAIGAQLVGTGLILIGIPRAEDVADQSPWGRRRWEAEQTRPPVREWLLVRVASVVLVAALAGAMVVSLVTGRPWELRGTPSLHAVEVAGLEAKLEVPTLIGPALQPDGRSWLAGSLGFDPLVVVLYVDATPLDDEQAADPEGTLGLSLETLGTPPHPGFKRVVENHVVKREGGRPVLFSEQKADDGRRELTWWFIDGKRLGRLQVLLHPDATAEWVRVAERLVEHVAL